MRTPRYDFGPMGEEEAREVSTWRYDPPYDFYDVARDPDDMAELLDPARRRNYYAARTQDGELAGFLCFGPAARVPGHRYGEGSLEEGPLDVGLGLRPDLTGRGLGLGFLLAGLEFARGRFSPPGFRLSVATFNERAIKVYERAGFRRGEVFVRETGGGCPFLVMERGA